MNESLLVAHHSSATDLTLFNIASEDNVITLAPTWLSDEYYERIVFVSDSLSTLEMVSTC